MLGFDTYYDGTIYRSSNSGSNFIMGKAGNTFQIYYGSGNAQGSGATMTVASSWDTSGNLTCSNNVNIGHGIINTGMQKMMIYGTDNSVNGPYTNIYFCW